MEEEKVILMGSKTDDIVSTSGKLKEESINTQATAHFI
jgi:hypothetical protein